jgi:hypothetical protein
MKPANMSLIRFLVSNRSGFVHAIAEERTLEFGIDVGIKSCSVDSDIRVVENPKHLRPCLGKAIELAGATHKKSHPKLRDAFRVAMNFLMLTSEILVHCFG